MGTGLDCMEELRQQIEKADRLAAITQRIGFALWQIQELEGVTAQYFVLVVQAKKGMGLFAGNALDEKAKKKTFGATINKVSKAGLLSAELESRFTNLLSERNWLVHRSRADSRGAIHSALKMQRLLARIDKMAEESLSLLREIGILSETHVKEHGVPEEYIDKKAKELLEQWHASDVI
ncbi:hypothetical protein DSCOOX_49170 [Desulfosarcina ovata subsp. ovata]|uniref:Uncharacterized protein n=2 Tax=Desulfosarcina ovata TaxID=83564 RepID=A0A5K8AGG5_9BACT|nr:hypothetical protein DSCOOX_49170 [Desulfosarcina ovata subsp. ovata]